MDLTITAASLHDALGRPLNNGANVVAVISHGGVTVGAPTMSRADVRLDLKPAAVDAVIEREATLGRRYTARSRPFHDAGLAFIHRVSRRFAHH
jgi:hypothetical protein